MLKLIDMANEFEIGNQAALKWDLDTTRSKFLEMLKLAVEDNSITSLQKCIFKAGIYPSSVNYLVNKFPVFKNIKKDIEAAIIARINDGALLGEKSGGYASTPAIWRMKMLGEREIVQEQPDQTINITFSTNTDREDERLQD